MFCPRDAFASRPPKRGMCDILHIALQKRNQSKTLALLLNLDGVIIIAILAFLVVLVVIPGHRMDPALLVNRPCDRSANLSSMRDIPSDPSRTGFINRPIMILSGTAG